MTYKYKTIKEYMKANNLVYADMDKILGVDQSTAFRWAANEVPIEPVSRFLKVSKKLSISPADLRPDVAKLFRGK